MTDPTPRRDAARSGPDGTADRNAAQDGREALCEACRAIRPLDRLEPFPGDQGRYRCADTGACRVRYRNLKRPAWAGIRNRPPSKGEISR
jgi:hypothetical protein